MEMPELEREWKRTEGYLCDARSHLSQIAEAEFSDALVEFQRFLEHNELGLAFDTLVSVAIESQWESMRVLELLALAAASMGLLDKQRMLDEQITKRRGWKYATVLPFART